MACKLPAKKPPEMQPVMAAKAKPGLAAIWSDVVDLVVVVVVVVLLVLLLSMEERVGIVVEAVVGRTNLVVVVAGAKAKADSQEAAAAKSTLRVKCRLIIVLFNVIIVSLKEEKKSV